MEQAFGCFDDSKTYLIFGTGTTGKAVIDFCRRHNLIFFVADDEKDNLKKLEVEGQKVEEKRKLYKWNEKVLREAKIDFLVLSPSVHTQKNKHKIVELAEEIGIEIIADIDLFYCYLQSFNQQHGTHKQIIGITGTNGKSTTTALVAHIFNQLGESAVACGNIGLNYLSLDVEKYELFVAEMSSYNLCLMKYAKFDCGCLLNITEDHLEYHGTMEKYIEAKEQIIFDSKKSVVCIDDNFCQALFNKANNQGLSCIEVSKNQVLNNGLYWKNNQFYMDGQPIYQGVYENLLGLHNVENILCAVAVAILTFSDGVEDIKDDKEKIALEDVLNNTMQQAQENFNEKIREIGEKEGINFDLKESGEKLSESIKNAEKIVYGDNNEEVKNNKNNKESENDYNLISNYSSNQNTEDKKEIELEDIFEAVKSFEGLPHRMQFVRNIDGIDFINDSKGTNANSTQQALRAYADKDVYLIAGGQRKTAGFDFLKDDLASVKCVFLIGDATKSFAKELDKLGVKYEKCDVMKKAVKKAFEVAKSDLQSGVIGRQKAVVLLSPLCASWDQYRNFEERGDDFVKCVGEL